MNEELLNQMGRGVAGHPLSRVGSMMNRRGTAQVALKRANGHQSLKPINNHLRTSSKRERSSQVEHLLKRLRMMGKN
jgi:hypothetical protein